MPPKAHKSRSDSTSSESSQPTIPAAADLEKIVAKAINAAMDVFKTEFGARLTALESRIEALEKTATDEATTRDLESRVQALENKNAAAASNDVTSTDLEAVQKNLRAVELQANDNEQYSRRNNLRIKGLKLNRNDDVRFVVHQFFGQQLHCHVDIEDIDAAHAVPVRAPTSSTSTASTSTSTATYTPRQPTVIVKLKRREIRDKIIKFRRQLKGTKITIQEDLTTLNLQTITRLQNSSEVKTAWSWNGKLFAELKNGNKITARPYQQLHECTLMN